MIEIGPDWELVRRTRLPDDLYYLLRRYPRNGWREHRNMGDAALFWLQRHAMFRELGDLLFRCLEEYREERLEARPFADYFVPRLRFFLQELNSHHQIEELHYFPIFARAEKGLRRGFQLLDNDHHIIHDVLLRNARGANDLVGALAGGHDASRFVADAYSHETEEMLRLLSRHLWDEEDLIVPVVLDRGESALGLD